MIQFIIKIIIRYVQLVPMILKLMQFGRQEEKLLFKEIMVYVII